MTTRVKLAITRALRAVTVTMLFSSTPTIAATRIPIHDSWLASKSGTGIRNRNQIMNFAVAGTWLMRASLARFMAGFAV
jgi:hypothetical protein